MGNDMQRVRPGERMHIPARTLNRILDATEAMERSGPIAGRTPRSWVQPTGTVFAVNGSGAFQGFGAPATITTVGPGGCAEFDLAGEAGPYAILLEPIAAGEVGLVAVAGGPWKVAVSGSVAAGDRLLPTEGEAYAEVDESGPLMALSADADGQCWCVFAAGGGGTDGTHANPATVGGTAETEAAQTDYWDREDQGANDGVQAVQVTRFAYNDAGDQILYAFYRTFTYDSVGALASISAETMTIIDTPDYFCT